MLESAGVGIQAAQLVVSAAGSDIFFYHSYLKSAEFNTCIRSRLMLGYALSVNLIVLTVTGTVGSDSSLYNPYHFFSAMHN